MLRLARNPRVFFICGSLNQTTQMHQIAAELPDCTPSLSPYYGVRCSLATAPPS